MKYTTQSEKWRRRAAEVMPGKQSNFRHRNDAPASLVLSESSDVRYKDVDGKEYIDYVIGMGPAIWGHSDEGYKNAISTQLEEMFSIGSAVAFSTLEIEVAELVCRHLPCAESVRFGISGSEAVHLAIRIARGYTKKDKFVRFSNNYHGWLENVFGGEMQDNVEPPYAKYDPNQPGQSAGRSLSVDQDSYMIPWNNIKALEALLNNHSSEIALLIMEPVMCNYGCCPPREGYLEKVRELCDKHDVLLCFDEVITGFRMSLQSGQGSLGVTPDLTILGKAFAGGLPLSAVAGKKHVLNVLKEGSVLGGGTFNSFPLAMAGAKYSIMKMEEEGEALFAKRNALQDRLMAGICQIGKQYGHKVMVQGPPGIFFIDFCSEDVIFDPAKLSESEIVKRQRFCDLMMENGVLVGGGSRMLISFAHTEKDVDDTLSIVSKVFSQL